MDENGHPVEKGIGCLKTSVLKGSYFVVFGLNSIRCCPLELDENVELSQADLESTGMIPKPTVRFPGDEGYVEYAIP